MIRRRNVSLSPRRSGLPDLRIKKMPNSGKPKFGWERVAREARRVMGARRID